MCYVPNDQTLLVSGSEDQTVRFWNTQTGQTISLLDMPNDVQGIAVSPDSKYVAVACSDGDCHIYHVEDNSLFTVLPGNKYDVLRTVTFSPDSRHIATDSVDRTIKIWRLDHSPELVKRLEGHEVRLRRGRLTGLY